MQYQQHQMPRLGTTQAVSTKLPTASPSLRARNLRMREWSSHSDSSPNASSGSASSSSLNSLNSARNGAQQASHFNMAGRSIMNQQAMQTGSTSSRQMPQMGLLDPRSAAQGHHASHKSISSVDQHSHRSGSQASHNSQDLAQIYSNTSGNRLYTSGSSSGSSRGSSRGSEIGGAQQRERQIHLSNVDFESSMDSIRPDAQNGVIRIDMQPKRQIRMREKQSPQAVAASSTVLFSRKGPSHAAGSDQEILSKAREIFKAGGAACKALEQTHLFGEGIIMRETESGESLLELDEEQGAEVCKSYMCSLERLMSSLGLAICSRSYRNDFTNSYKVLYRQMQEHFGSQTAYLPEILDSAQEAFDHLWVNGEKYVFSEHVIESGTQLYHHFQELRHFASTFYQNYFEGRSTDEGLATDFPQLKKMLVIFDEMWTSYEQKYVYELMVIEGDARRFIIESINLEASLEQADLQLPAMTAVLTEKRSSLLDNICQVNSVANQEGKGRDDFQIKLLLTAERLLKPQKAVAYCKAVGILARNVKQTFDSYRDLMCQYRENIELVDPQLKNNEPLVKVITAFEDAWSLAQNQIGSSERLDHLNQFSKLLQQTQKEVPEFQEQVDCRDASIFMSIPALLIMKALLSDQSATPIWHSLCHRFKEGITTQEEFVSALSTFQSLAGAKTLLQSLRLSVLEVAQVTEMQAETNQVKHLGMELQRSEPMEWNEFMTACLVDE